MRSRGDVAEFLERGWGKRLEAAEGESGECISY